MSSPALSLDFASALDVGRARHNNEDAVLVDAALRLCVLADGMGGYNAGEVASDLAVRTVQETLAAARAEEPELPLPDALVQAAQEANQRVFEAATTVREYQGMGTTLVLALFDGRQAWVGHLGDSRAYRWRNGRLEQLTRDHSLLQEQIDAGLLTPEEAATAPHRNLVTRAVGVEPEVVLEVHPHPVQAGDLLLLCSDGLSDMLSDADIATCLDSVAPLEQLTAALVRAANEAGGRDNISVILARAQESQT